VAVQLAPPAAAEASAFPISQLVFSSAGSGPITSAAKTLDARCPSGTRVFGGGGDIDDSRTGRVMLTELQPFSDLFRVTAAAQPGFTGTWRVTAYAICGPPVAGLEYVDRWGVSSSNTFQGVDAPCSPGKRIISSGGEVSTTNGRVGLHLVRPDGYLTIGRTAAREIAAGYAGTWFVVSHAVCAYPFGQQNAAHVVPDWFGTVAVCPSGTLSLGAGGGGSLFDVGPYFLQGIVPDLTFEFTVARLNGTPPNGMVAQATCA
jgi:hypothetical protein